MSKLKLKIICPVYNEEEIIEAFNDRLCNVILKLIDIDSKIVYVVDRGTDKTLEILTKIAFDNQNIIVVSMSSRFGHQSSLIAGIDFSLDSDAIIMMDSDLQHPPELIPILLERFMEGYEIVNTVRLDTEHINPLRKYLGNLFYSILSKISKIPINHNASDFRLISSKVASILSHDFKERNLFLRGIFSWMGFNQINVAYTANARKLGKSKYSINRIIKFAIDGIISFSAEPLRLGILIGLIFSMISVILLIWFLLEYFFNKALPNGWTTLITMQLLFSGILLIVMGVIGFYIGGIYEEVKERPRYIIDKIFNYEKK